MTIQAGHRATGQLQAEIRRLARERQAVIVAHNYQVPEVQDVADYVGDSLGLAIRARDTGASVIVVCGVYFMAETAKILNYERTVLIPDVTAGCSLADSITVEQLRAWKARHPGALVVSYVNTTADVKAESDYCVTSGNAATVLRSIPEERTILFLPDMFLGEWLKRTLGLRNLRIWPGECHVHAGIRPEEIEEQRQMFPDAELLIHPECGCTTRFAWAAQEGLLSREHTHVLSTEGMARFARTTSAGTLVVATETGILHRLRKEAPDKLIVPADDGAVCPYMKRITLEKLYDTLRTMHPEVRLPRSLAAAARRPIERMLAVGT